MAKESSAKKKPEKATSTELALPSSKFEIQDDQIPDTIPGVIELIKSIEKEVRKTALVYWWNIGKIIKAIQDDEGRYGAKAVETVAEELNKSDRLLWAALRFYNDHDDFEHVTDMAIEWSAAREIQRVPDPKERAKLEAKAEKEDMTVREVKEEVNKVKGKDVPPDKKPKAAGPNALGYFIKLDTYMDKARKETDKHLEDMSAMLALVGDEARTPDEDYNIIVEGLDTKDPLALIISKKAVYIIDKLQKYVVPLKDTFNDAPSEDSESEDSEEAE
jgi:hypothetical protein